MESTTMTKELSARDRLASGLEKMVNEADQVLSTAQRTGADQLNAARDKFEAQLRKAREALDALQDSAVYNAKRAARATDQVVHEHPYASIGIAAGVGVLIGMLIARR
jgi:ElaB/YqjD/DUF883 family membrane-anchored ribosome-binding protein